MSSRQLESMRRKVRDGQPIAERKSTHPCGTFDQSEADLLVMAEPEDLATARDRVEAANISGVGCL